MEIAAICLRRAEHVGVEVGCPLHVAAHARDLVEAAKKLNAFQPASSVSTGADVGSFLSGSRKGGFAALEFRRGSTLAGQVRVDHSQVDLAEGSFDATLASARAGYSFTPNIFLQGLVQYGSQSNSWSGNIRFGWLNTAGTGCSSASAMPKPAVANGGCQRPAAASSRRTHNFFGGATHGRELRDEVFPETGATDYATILTALAALKRDGVEALLVPAFFTATKTGELMNRLNSDVVGAQQRQQPPRQPPVQRAAQVGNPQHHLGGQLPSSHPWLSCAMRREETLS